MSAIQQTMYDVGDTLEEHDEIYVVMCSDGDHVHFVSNASARQLKQFQEVLAEAQERQSIFPAELRN